MFFFFRRSQTELQILTKRAYMCSPRAHLRKYTSSFWSLAQHRLLTQRALAHRKRARQETTKLGLRGQEKSFGTSDACPGKRCNAAATGYDWLCTSAEKTAERVAQRTASYSGCPVLKFQENGKKCRRRTSDLNRLRADPVALVYYPGRPAGKAAAASPWPRRSTAARGAGPARCWT